MCDKYALVEHSSAINTIIHETFQTTQRIKLTAFDVSNKYIIFGTNSGGIYIFTREPCQFLKLIPSTHGATTFVKISPNEEHLAIASASSLVIMIKDCFNPHFEQQVSTQHEGALVTAMHWSATELYSGDSQGRVCVISIKSFLSKAIFHPVACLMHLDSSIVQLDTYLKFLLVSTKSRSLLCDTESERYRQVGKKMRDGLFGSCFINTGVSPEFNSTSRTWGVFNVVGDSEQLAPWNETDVKIYCARPGARLWQADFQANVVLTHQFRSLLGQKPSEIILWGDNDELKVSRSEGEIGEFSFGCIWPLLDRFILTYNDKGFYVFEPSHSALSFWSYLSNIKDIKIVDSFLYIWHNDDVTTVALWSLEELILRTLVRKKYKLCAELSVHFFREVEAMLPTSKKIHLIAALEDKLDSQMLEELAPIFQKLKALEKQPFDKINGIVTVNVLPVSVQDVEEKDTSLSILLEQFKISKIQATIETTDFMKLMQSLQPQDLFDLLHKFQKATDDCDLWCKKTFLKYLQGDCPDSILEYASEAFLQINENHLACKCGFPLPEAHTITPKHYKVGCLLMQKIDKQHIVGKVPQMYKQILKEVQLNLPLLVQFSDPELIEFHSNNITYDSWDEFIRLLAKLKASQCLNCGFKVDPKHSLDWTQLGILMSQSINPTNTIKLMKRYANLIPKGGLDNFFYQYCIFSSVTKPNSSLIESLKHPESQKQFDFSVGSFLRRKYLCSDYYDPHTQPVELQSCDQCQLPLKNLVLEEKKLECGHCYHQVCFLAINEQCYKCVQSILQ